VAAVTILSRPDDTAPWCVRGSGVFYRLRRGNTLLESPPLEIGPLTDRQWLVRISQPGTGFGTTPPRLEIGWLPHRLVFAARGDGPYRLAFGSGRRFPAGLRDAAIAASLEEWEKAGVKPLPAVAGPSVAAGGPQALRHRIAPATWKNVTLWGMLAGAVALLGWMAWRLAREMNDGGGQKGDEPQLGTEKADNI
jgi:hypothetical protein